MVQQNSQKSIYHNKQCAPVHAQRYGKNQHEHKGVPEGDEPSHFLQPALVQQQ